MDTRTATIVYVLVNLSLARLATVLIPAWPPLVAVRALAAG